MEFFKILSVSLREVHVGHSRFKFATFACAPKGTSSYQYCQLRFYGSAKFFLLLDVTSRVDLLPIAWSLKSMIFFEKPSSRQ